MRELFQISRGDKGIRQTMRWIIDMGADYHGKVFWRTMAICYPPRVLDGYLRSRWLYVPDEQDGQPAETIRTLDRLQADVTRTGQFEGDCDDAGVAAVAVLLQYQRNLKAAALVAARPASDPDFTCGHVFCVAADDSGSFRVDPTAPIGADYTAWEKMQMPLF